MTGCEACQAQLLAYLYDLLEPAERQALQEHLEACEACRAALSTARRQQGLLAAAAKREFPGVRFQAPAPEPAGSAQTQNGRRRAWALSLPGRRWAVAAGILVLLGVGTPATWCAVRSWQEQRQVAAADERLASLNASRRQAEEAHQQRVEPARQRLREVEKQGHQLVAKQHQEADALADRLRARQLDVLVSGPATVQPGAPNAFRIQTYNWNNQPVPAQLHLRVRAQDHRVVYEQEGQAPAGTYQLALPPDLPMKPGSKLSLEVVARRDGGPEQQVREELPLAAPVYLTHLYTDKPMYRPGETVHFRSLTLERFSLQPASEDLHLVFTITNGRGQEVFRRDGAAQVVAEKTGVAVLGPDGKPIRGIGAAEYTLDAAAEGGEYTLAVREAQNRFAPEERKFLVNRYENARLNKELDFTRKSYGPGDEVVAACKVSRAEGGSPVVHQPVTARLQIDGKAYGPDGREGARPLELRTDEQGAVAVRFRLPTVMERGLATLAVTFHDGGSIETLVRPVPIVLKKLQVEFFPEGGDLVAGLPNRVYFQARTMLDKPAELQGRIVDQDGTVVAERVETLHDDRQPGANQGLGVFAFTPQAGRKYELKIDSPAGMEGRYELPAAKEDGVVLTVAEGVATAQEPLRVTVQSARRDRTLLVGAYCRGRLMDHQRVTAPKGAATAVDLHPAREIGGVYRVTVFAEHGGAGPRPQLTPVAERLVYRTPARELILKAMPDRKLYTPGEKVKLALTALNEKEQPAPAVALVAVVDKSLITMADEKTARTMPTHFYLTTEVRRPEDLEYADFLLTAHPKARAALDLLLGTQGWRRFAEQNPGQFKQRFGADADRLLVQLGQSARQDTAFAQAEVQKLQAGFAAEMAKWQEQQTRAQGAVTAAQNDPEFRAKLSGLGAEMNEAQLQRAEALSRLAYYRNLAEKLGSALLPVAVPVVLVGTLVLLVLAIRKGLPHGLPYYAMAVGASILVAGLVLLVPRNQEPTLQIAFQATEPSREPRARGGMAVLRKAAPMAAEAPAAMARRAPAEVKDQAMPTPENLASLGAAGEGRDNRPEAARLATRAAGAKRKGFLGLGQQVAQPYVPAPAPFGVQQQAAGVEAGRGLERDKKADRYFLANKDARVPEAAKKPIVAEREVEQLRRLREVARRNQPGAAGPAPAAALALPQAKQAMQAMTPAVPEAQVQPAGRPAAGLIGNGAGRGGFGGGMQGGLPQQAGRAMGGLDFRRGRLLLYAPGQNAMPGLQAGDRLGYIAPPPPPPFVVREYAHQRPSAQPAAGRSDFVDTVSWQPALVLPDGKAEVSFDLCDAATSYQVTAFAHTLDGRLGAVRSTLEARLPFALEPKLPLEVTAGDKIDVPVSIINNTNEPRPIAVRVAPAGLSLRESPGEASLTLAADGRARRLFRLQPTLVEGQAQVALDGTSGPFSDHVTRSLRVVPDGFPMVGSRSDMLEGVAQNPVVLPESWITGTLQCRVQVYPSTLADLQKGLEGLLQEPGGCFEQASSTNYPNVLILNYLRESDQAKPELESRARSLLASGYRQLTGFECLDSAHNKRQGYEWFGGTAPPHEALTAYGLLEFRDMARVSSVDQAMLERTRHYLLARRDGKGGFLRNPQALDSFGRAPEAITNAYIVWALTESGPDDVEKELAALKAQAKDSRDPYFLALVALSLLNRGQADAGTALLKTVAAEQQADGHLDAATTSITGSGGRDLQIETTALAVLGWLKANRPADFNVPLQKAIKWIGQQRGGYGAFGSTQSTILALKALIAYTKANRKIAEAGELRLAVGNQVVNQLVFPANAQEALVLDLPEPEKHLRPGKNLVKVELTGKNSYPYTLTWSYRTRKPVSAEQCPVRIRTDLDRSAVAEGETVHLTVAVENQEAKGQGMAVAVVGLPAGLTLPEDMKQLKEYARLRNGGKERGLIDAWETRGRELVLYWRDLAPRQKVEVPIDLIGRVPGEYRGPAGRAYLYYNADRKHWVEPLTISIQAKAE